MHRSVIKHGYVRICDYKKATQHLLIIFFVLSTSTFFNTNCARCTELIIEYYEEQLLLRTLFKVH